MVGDENTDTDLIQSLTLPWSITSKGLRPRGDWHAPAVPCNVLLWCVAQVLLLHGSARSPYVRAPNKPPHLLPPHRFDTMQTALQDPGCAGTRVRRTVALVRAGAQERCGAAFLRV